MSLRMLLRKSIHSGSRPVLGAAPFAGIEAASLATHRSGSRSLLGRIVATGDWELPGPGLMLLSLVLALCAGLIASASGITYKFSPAGTFPGARPEDTEPADINLAGDIVGAYFAGNVQNGYLQHGSVFTALAPFGSLEAYATGVNNLGVVVGGYCPDGCNLYAAVHGFSYSAGVYTIVDYPDTGTASGAYGINDLGQIVGGYCPGAAQCPGLGFAPTNKGYLDTDGVFTTIDYPGASNTQPFAINNAGVIVGIYDINLTGPHAFRYENGVYTNIDYPGSAYTYAHGVNNLGVVSGSFADTFGVHGFTYRSGKFSEVNAIGAETTGFGGINDHGVLVGSWTAGTHGGTFKAAPVAAPEADPTQP